MCFMCTHVPECMNVCRMQTGTDRGSNRVSDALGVTGGCTACWACWKPSLCSLQEQEVLLATELSLCLKVNT